MTTINMKSYWSVTSSDYHDFINIASIFNNAGIPVRYEEVGCTGQYQAVFWVKNRPSKYIKEQKAKFASI